MANNVKVTITGQNDAEALFRNVEHDLEKLRNLAETVGIALSIREVTEAVDHVLQLGDSMERAAKKTGMTVEQLSSLRYAAKLADQDQGALDSALNAFARGALTAVETGTGKAAAAYKALGISIVDQNGKIKPMGELLEEVSRKVAALPPGIERAGTASVLFGREGAALLPVLLQTAKGFGDLEKQASSAGQLMSTETAHTLAEMDDQIKKLKGRVEGLAVSFVATLAPAIRPTMNYLDDATTGMNRTQVAAQKLGSVINLVAYSVADLTTQWQKESIEGRILGATMDLLGMKAANLAGAHFDTTAQEQHIEALRGELGQLAKDWQQTRDIFEGNYLPPLIPASSHGPKPGPGIDLDAKDKGTGKPTGKGTTLDRTKEIQDAIVREREAGAAAQIAIARALEKEELAMLQLEQDQGLLTLQQYYDKRGQIQQQAWEREIEQDYAKLDALLAKRRSLPAGPGIDRMNVDAQIEKANADIMAKVHERGETEAKNTAEELQHRRELRDFLISTEAEIRSAKGQTLQVAIEAIQREYEEKRAKLRTMGGSPQDLSGIDLVEKQKIAQTTAQNVAAEIDAINSKLEMETQRLQDGVMNYSITAIDAETRTNALRDQAVQKVAELVRQYRALAAASGDPKMMAESEQMSLKLDEMRRHADMLREAVGEGLTNGFQGFFSTLMQSGSAAKAFESFAESIIASMERMISQMLVMYAMQKLMGFMFPSAGSIGSAGSAGGASVGASAASAGLPMLASGGDLSAYQPAIIGEKGPELWIPATSGTVVPNAALSAGGGGGSQRPPNIALTVVNNGTQKTAQTTQPEWNEQLKAWHMQLHLDDAVNNGPLSQNLNKPF
jgi:minor tail protein